MSTDRSTVVGTSEVSPEGRPARRVSPHRLAIRVAIMLVAVVLGAAICGALFGVPGAVVAVILVGAIAVAFNPEMWSAKPRVEDAGDAREREADAAANRAGSE